MDFRTLSQAILKEHEAVFAKMDEAGLLAFIDLLKRHQRIFLIGVGREGLATRALAMRLAHMGKESHWIWDDTTPGLGPGDLLVATLGDGQIGHINYVCERAKEAGAHLCVVTGSPSGRTASKLADQILFLPAAVYRGRDEVVPSVQPMGNLFEQCLLILFDIAVMLMVDSDPDQSFEKMSHRHRNVE